MNSFLTESQISEIEDAIGLIEEQTTGEIVVCIKHSACYDGNSLSARGDGVIGKVVERTGRKNFANHSTNKRRNDAVWKHAKLVVRTLCLKKTKDRTGVLLFISPEDRVACVWGDTAITEVIQDWVQVIDPLLENIREGKNAEGVLEAVNLIGKYLIEHFHSSDPRNTNELPNALVRIP